VVPTETLDNIYNNRDYPDLIKIDVEGNELPVIKGSIEVLKHSPDLFIELHQSIINEPHKELEDISKILSTKGYRKFYHLESDSVFEIERLDTCLAEVAEQTHIFVSPSLSK
jgi:hypothetical protein